MSQVKPRGFYYHRQYHTNLTQLVAWFKRHFGDAEYQRDLRKYNKPPTLSNYILLLLFKTAYFGNNENDSELSITLGDGLNKWQGVSEEWRNPGEEDFI